MTPDNFIWSHVHQYVLIVLIIFIGRRVGKGQQASSAGCCIRLSCGMTVTWQSCWFHLVQVPTLKTGRYAVVTEYSAFSNVKNCHDGPVTIVWCMWPPQEVVGTQCCCRTLNTAKAREPFSKVRTQQKNENVPGSTANIVFERAARYFVACTCSHENSSWAGLMSKAIQTMQAVDCCCTNPSAPLSLPSMRS